MGNSSLKITQETFDCKRFGDTTNAIEFSSRLNFCPLFNRDLMPGTSQNTFNKIVDLKLENTRKLQLREGQTTLLSSPFLKSSCVHLAFQKGIGRFSISLENYDDDITLGFCGNSPSEWIRLPKGASLLLEALSDCILNFSYEDNCPIHEDLLMQWLFDFHLVRHPVGADARLVSLIRLLVMRFGIKENKNDSYLLPFNLGHARMAELIGATRSTVTRQITRLRQNKFLLVDEVSGRYVFTGSLIEQSINT